MTALRRAWNGWKRVAHAIGDVQARILLGLFYFVVLSPCALMMRRAERGGWRPAAAAPGSALDRARQQY